MKQYGRKDKWYGSAGKRPGGFNYRSKLDRQAWWRGLTAEEQANYIVRKREKAGLPVNWREEYEKCLKKGQCLKKEDLASQPE